MIDSAQVAFTVEVFGHGVQCLYSKAWASVHSDHRQKIRRSLKESLPIDCQIFQKTIADLNVLPSHQDYGISISHCPSLGGYAFCRDGLGLGLDFEEEGRVNSGLIRRVASPNEVELEVPPVALWVIKEACFKALKLDQQTGITQSVIEVRGVDVQPKKSHFLFEAKVKDFNFVGRVFPIEDTSVWSGVALIK